MNSFEECLFEEDIDSDKTFEEIIKLAFLTNEDYEFSSGFIQKYSDEIYDFITSASYKDYDEDIIKSLVRIINQLITYKGKTVLENRKKRNI